MIGRKYILKVDCYLSEYLTNNDKMPIVLFPNIKGRNGGFPLPVSKANIGYVRQDMKIIDVIPKGTEFDIINAIHLHSFETDIWDYEVNMLYNRKSTLVSARWLTDIFSTPPKFLHEIAVPK